MSEGNVETQTESVVLSVSDMVIRYGVSEMEVLQYFMHAGLPYHKTDNGYTFYENEIKEWESATKCISWDVGQFDTKYYDLENSKFLARSDYAERMGLESARRDRYLLMKQKAEKAEEERLQREQKKENKRNVLRLILLCIAGICFVIAKFCHEQSKLGFYNTYGFQNGTDVHDEIAALCFFAVAIILIVITLFTFPQFRILLAFGLVILAVVGVLLMIHESQIRSGFISNNAIVNEWTDNSAGGAATINSLGN